MRVLLVAVLLSACGGPAPAPVKPGPVANTEQTSALQAAAEPVETVAASKSVLWVKLLNDVSGRLLALKRGADGRWTGQATALPDKSTIHLDATASTADRAFVTVEGMLTPPTLFSVAPDRAPVAVQSLPARFDASNMAVEQHFATSKDGIGKNGRTGKYVGGGALLGTIIGAIAGGGKGAAIGAIAGGAGGASAQVLTRGGDVRVPAESILTFRLQQPLTVDVADRGYDRRGRHYHYNDR